MATGGTAGAANSTSSQDSKRIMEGPLCKWTNVVHGWQYRWFVLDQVAGLLSYSTVRTVRARVGRYTCVSVRPCGWQGVCVRACMSVCACVCKGVCR